MQKFKNNQFKHIFMKKSSTILIISLIISMLATSGQVLGAGISDVIDDVIDTFPKERVTWFLDTPLPRPFSFISYKWALILAIAVFIILGVILPMLGQLLWMAVGLAVVYFLLSFV